MVELLLARSSSVGGLGSSISSNVAAEDTDILQELSELGVGEDEFTESSKVFDGLLSILLHILLGSSSVDVLDLISGRSLNLGGVVTNRIRTENSSVFEDENLLRKR